jgi:hypothetical protein
MTISSSTEAEVFIYVIFLDKSLRALRTSVFVFWSCHTVTLALQYVCVHGLRAREALTIESSF